MQSNTNYELSSGFKIDIRDVLFCLVRLSVNVLDGSTRISVV